MGFNNVTGQMEGFATTKEEDEWLGSAHVTSVVLARYQARRDAGLPEEDCEWTRRDTIRMRARSALRCCDVSDADRLVLQYAASGGTGWGEATGSEGWRGITDSDPSVWIDEWGHDRRPDSQEEALRLAVCCCNYLEIYPCQIP